MHPRYVPVAEPAHQLPRHLALLLEPGVVGWEHPHVLQNHLVWLAAEAVDLEPAHSQHFVMALCIVDWNEATQQGLLRFELP